jgi:hypothetical protein
MPADSTNSTARRSQQSMNVYAVHYKIERAELHKKTVPFGGVHKTTVKNP